MENKPSQPPPEIAIEFPKTFTISEITAKYKKQNNDLVEALEVFESISSIEFADVNDIRALKKLNLSFIKYPINELEISIHGEGIYINILETLFRKTLNKATKLFGYSNSNYWGPMYENIQNTIIQNDVDVSHMLILFRQLYESLIEINHLCIYYYLEDEHCCSIVNFDIIAENFDFNIAVEEANKFADLKERINFYHREIATKELICVREDENKVLIDECRSFINKCYKAIEITQNHWEKTQQEIKIQLQEINKEETSPDLSQDIPDSSAQKNSTNPAFTTSRQVLAIYYLLNEIDRKAINQIDKTEKARFIEFLTSKNFNNIYKALSNPFKGLDKKNPKSFLNDVEYIKTHFEKMGLHSIIQQIDKDIDETSI